MATDQRGRALSLAVTALIVLSVATAGLAAFTEPADASSVSVRWQDEPPETVAEGNNIEVSAGVSVSEQSRVCLVDSDTVGDDQLVCEDVYSWDDSISFSVSASEIRDADIGDTAELEIKVSHTHYSGVVTHSDSTSEVSTTYKQAGDFTLTVEDGSGSEFSGATVDFYEDDGDDWNTIGEKTTDYNGEVTWYDQIEGSYHVEVLNGDEYWGTYEYELSGDSTSKTFQRQAPYITSTSTSGDGEYKQNEGFELSADVENDAPADKEVEVKFYIDGERELTVPGNIPAGSSETFERSFAVGDPGNHDYEIKVATIYDDNWMTTDMGVSGSFSINEQPTASRENPSDREITVERGNSVTFEVDGSDGDGDLSTVNWDTPNGISQDSIYGSDATPEKTVSFSSTGLETVSGSVSDEHGATSDRIEWTVNVVKPTGTIEATVVESGQTVSDATVILLGEDRSKTTEYDGTATFEDVEEGTYNLAYHVNGQHRGGGQVSVSDATATIELNRVAPLMTDLSIDDGNGDADGKLELGDPTTISPTVYNDESASHPVTTVISVRGPDGDFARATNGERLDSVTRKQTVGSDSYGHFGVDVDPRKAGEYEVKVVTKTDYGNGPVKTDETGWQSAFSVPEAEISGQVTADSTGTGVGDAAVYLDGSRVATTDAGGSYSTSVDSVGTYDLRVEADSFETAQQTVDVSRGDVSGDVALQGKPQDVFFEVSKATSLDGYEFDGEPVVGATVEINGETYSTDSEGSVDIALEPGTYEYTVSAPDYETFSGELTVYPSSANAVSVPLVKDNVGIVELDVVDAEGTGIGGNLYRVLVDGEPAEPNAEGELLLEKGTRTVRVEPTDFGRSEGVQPVEKDVDVVAGARKQVTFKPTSVELSVSFENANRGTVTVDGQTLSQSGTVTVPRGETVTVSASPASGYSFDYWLGAGNADRESQSVSLTVDESREVTPLFTRGQDIGIDISRSETVTGSPVSLKADVPDGISVSKYKWTTVSVPSGDDGVPAFPEHNNAKITSFRPEAPGEYELSLSVTTESGEEKTAFVTLTVNERSDLISKYAPVVEFHSDEEYYPTRIEAYVRNAELTWDGGSDAAPTLWDLPDAPPSSHLSPKGDESEYSSFDNSYPRTIYASVHENAVQYEGEQYTAVTYWMFYVHDPKGSIVSDVLASHPTDTETVTVLLQDGAPEWVAASQHLSGERREWSKVDTSGTHPVVYPAEGAHSNYLRNSSAYEGAGLLLQSQFVPFSGDDTEPITASPPVSDQTGGGEVWSPDGSVGKDYELAVLTGEERWQTYSGSLMPGRVKLETIYGKVSPPAQRVRWTEPGEWVANITADEAQLGATILDAEINDDDGTVAVTAENTGPKPHTFDVTVEAKPSSASWSGSEVEQIQDMPMPLGTRQQKTMRTPSSLVPTDRSEPWDVRVTLRGYDSQVAEGEDTFDTLVTSTAAEQQMDVTWTASPTTGAKIDVEATVDHAEDGVESIDVVWDTDALNIGGDSAPMDRVSGTSFEKTIPPNDTFEFGEDVEVKVEVTDGGGNSHTTETRTVSVRERTETNLTVHYPAGTDGNGNVIFEGRLETANGDPIPNQPVKLLDESGSFTPPNELATARTDENGQFTITWDAEQMGGDDVETWVAFENSSSEYASARYPDEEAGRYYVQVEPSLQVFRPELVVTETATTVRQGNETTLFPIHYAAGGMETDPPADMPKTVTAVEGLPADAYSIQPSINQLLTNFPLSTIRATGYAASVTVDAGELSPGSYDVTVYSATPYTEQSTKREVTLEVVADDVGGARQVAYDSAARSISPTWWQNSAMVTVLRDTGIQDPVRYSLEKVKSMTKSLRSPKKAAVTPLKILGETYVTRVVPLLGSVDQAQVGEVLAKSAQQSGTDLETLESRLSTASDEIAAGNEAAARDEVGTALANLREWQLTLETMDTDHPSARETAVEQLESVEQFLLAEYRYLSETTATVEAFDTPTETVQAGETVESSVTVTNNGTTDETFFVGYSAVGPSGETYDDSGQTGTQVSLAAGESTTVSVSWPVPDGAPTGGYDLVAAVWSDRPGDGDATRFDEARSSGAVRVTDTPDTGTLAVNTASADAAVYVDGEMQGTGDQSLTLGAGEHTLRVTKSDFESVERTVSVAAGETTTETVSLSPKPATLSVSANVSDTTVTVEGSEVGSAPVSVERSPGEYEVVVRADGYQTATRTVSLSPNERASVSVNLEPEPEAGTEPPEASVAANRSTVSVGGAVSLDASNSIDPDGSNSALSYDWMLAESPTGVDVSPFPSGEQSAVTFSAAGTYTFEVTVTDAAGEIDTDTVTVTVESTGSKNPPTISEFRLLNPSENTLRVQFDSPGSATEIRVPITADGDSVTTLTEADFTKSDGTYTATYTPGRSGEYTATLERVANENGNGASGQEATVSVSTAREYTVDITSPTQASPVTLDANTESKLQITTEVTITEQMSDSELQQLVAALTDSSPPVSVSVGNEPASIEDLTFSPPSEIESGTTVPMTLVVEAPSHSKGTYNLTVETDAIDGMTLPGNSATSRNAVVYESDSTSASVTATVIDDREVRFEVTNDASEARTLELAVDPGTPGTVTTHSSIEGTWQSAQTGWVFEDVPPGETVTGTVEVVFDDTFAGPVDVVGQVQAGGVAVESASATLTKDANQPPVVEPNGPYTVESGTTVTLEAMGTRDPDGSVTSKTWTVTEGPGSVQDGTYVAPDSVTGEETATVGLEATDDDGASATGSTTVTVTPPAPTVSGFSVLNPSEYRVRVSFNTTQQLSTIEVPITRGPVTVATLTESDFTYQNGEYVGTADTELPGRFTATLAAAANDYGDAASDQSADVTVKPVDRTPPQLGATVTRVDVSTARVNLTTTEPIDQSTLTVNVTLPTGEMRQVSMTPMGDRYTGTFDLAEQDGLYTVKASATDDAGNDGIDTAEVNLRNVSTTNKQVVVKSGQSGAFVRFNTTAEVSNTFVTLTSSDAPLDPLSADFVGAAFLNGQLGDRLSANLDNATIGIPVTSDQLPTGVTPENVTISRFDPDTETWTDIETEVREVSLSDGTSGTYWVATVQHFSTYGAVAQDDTPPRVSKAAPDGELSFGTSEPTVRFEYDDAASSVNASEVKVFFDGANVTDSERTLVGSRTARYQATGLDAGETYNATVRVVDEAGNAQNVSTTFTIPEDTSPPQVLSMTPPSNTTLDAGTKSVPLTVSYLDDETGVAPSEVEVTFDDEVVTGKASVNDTHVVYTANTLTNGSTHTFSVRIPDSATHANVVTETIKFSVAATNTSSGSGEANSGGGSGGGGGGQSSMRIDHSNRGDFHTVKITAPESLTDIPLEISDGARVDGMGVQQLDIRAMYQPEEIEMYVYQPTESPELDVAPLSEGTLISYFQVSLRWTDSKHIGSVRTHFTVPEDQLPDDAAASDVVLYQYQDGEWRALSTNHVEGSSYQARGDGVGQFAIGIQDAPEETTAQTTQSEASTTSETTAEPTTTDKTTSTPDATTSTPDVTTSDSDDDGSGAGIPGFGIATALVALLAAALLAARRPT